MDPKGGLYVEVSPAGLDCSKVLDLALSLATAKLSPSSVRASSHKCAVYALVYKLGVASAHTHTGVQKV